jgi:NADPH2:quinone reductase
MTHLPMGQRVVVSEFGETPPDAVQHCMTLEPMPAPEPGPLDVVVRVRSAAVGWVDLLMASGQYQHMAQPPYTPGLECAGEVAALGSEVRGLAIGERVLVDGLLAGPRSSGNYQQWGSFATYVVAPAAGVLAIPGTLTFDQAAGLLSSYETAYHCLVTRGKVQPGETVLVHGASGATGLAAVQVAKILGARVIATGRSAERLAVVQALGADHVVVIDGPFREPVKALTGGRGVDVVYDPVGGEVTLESLRCVKFGARLLIVGWASTPLVAHGKGQRGAPNANVLPTNLLMMKGLDVLGCPMAIATAQDPSLRAPRLAQVLEWARTGAIQPHVSQSYDLAQFREALEAKWRGEVIGGSVLRP